MSRALSMSLLLPGLLAAATGTITLSLEFRRSDFQFDRVNGFDFITLPGEYLTSGPGLPCLPLVSRNVAIPADAEVVGVELTALETERLDGEFDIHPCQRPMVLSRPEPAFVVPDPTAYASLEEYPDRQVASSGSGQLGGFRVASIQVVPLSYLAGLREPRLARRMAIEVHYQTGRHVPLALSPAQIASDGERVRGLVANAADIARFAPAARETDSWTCDLMLVTSAAMAPHFRPYADWKTLHGYKTVIVSTESIYATYPGRDAPERIRNCVIDYWRNRGLRWVLLGGDDDIVPVRKARLTVEGYVEDIATDMYYADLQWSWDSNRNDLFGEMTDTVDFFHDVLVGRAPVDNAADVANFFVKCTTYRQNPDTGYIRRVLYGSTELWDPFHGRAINRMIAEGFPADWRHAHLEDPSYGVYADSMDRGFQLAHVAAHGSPSTFSVLDQSEVAGLSNGLRKLNFVNSIACQSGWFDGEDCLAEALVNCRTGGCIATMLNSRYGFGYPPGFGPSEMLDLEFYRYFLRRAASSYGDLCALSKDHFQGLSMGQEVWRWCVYELNLFGDPTLDIWSRPPSALMVTRPDSVPAGPQVVRVTVSSGASSVAGALVCLGKAGETYARGRTNQLGHADLLVQPATAGNLTLTASAPDFYPLTALIPVRGSASRPALIVDRVRVEDGRNGRLDPGETAAVRVVLANSGSASATGVSARLRPGGPGVVMLDSTAGYGAIAAGDTAAGDGFVIRCEPWLPLGTEAVFVATVTAVEGVWEPDFVLRVGDAPPPRRLWADHDTGNIILSVTSLGSIGTLGPYREGSGLKYPRAASFGSLYFTSFACAGGPSYVVDRWYGQPTSTWQTDWRVVDTLRLLLPPLAAHEEYQAVIDDGGHASPRGLTVTQWSGSLAGDDYGDFVVISYSLENRGSQPIVGLHAGIFSDFDINNTTSNNVYSDTGRRLVYMTQSSGYENSAGLKLLSPATAANLAAIDHAVYVTPGPMMTEAVKDSFLRGAIQRPNSNRAANWSCVVSAGPFDLNPGDRRQAAFAIVGGNTRQQMLVHADSAQSWYDHRMPSGVTATGPAGVPRSLLLSAVPNPVRSRAALHYAMPANGQARLAVYDAAGRVVRVLADGPHRAGSHTTTWDGTDSRAEPVARGVYVYRLQTRFGSVSRNAVVLR